MRSVALLAAAAVATVASANPLALRADTSWMPSRRLDESSYVNIEDFSGYNMQFGKCARVKVPQNNNDDNEGNSYFANGRYHAQYQQYASFFLCEDDGKSTCSCDYSTEYVTDLQTYLEKNIEYLQGMCEACSTQCNRRRLEEGAEEEAAYEYQPDCSTCVNTCSSINSNDGVPDESDYLECQEAYEDEENGIQYYSAPKCDANGNVVIGLFYDDECTVKTAATLDNGFTYATFKTIENSCISCADGLCEDLYDDALHCVNGNTMNGNDDDMPVCKTYKNTAARMYSERKKQLKILPFVIAALVLVGFIVSSSYTYYVRHKRKTTTPLANLDQTHLPPIS
jgi:hypothetical protein